MRKHRVTIRQDRVTNAVRVTILKRDNSITSVELISTAIRSIVVHCNSIVKQMNDDFVGEHGIRFS